MRKVFTLLIVLICIMSSCAAQSIEDIRELASAGGNLSAVNGILRGVIVSDWRSMNMETCPNLSYDCVDVSLNARTAYMVNEDGTSGVRLVFKGVYDNRLEKGMRVELSLKDCEVEWNVDPDCCTITGLVPSSILSAVRGEPLKPRVKEYSSLTDEDVFTYVSIDGLEFADKNGSYLNIHEGFGQPSLTSSSANGYMDAWATMLKCSEGGGVYCFINSRCAWRRLGDGVPQGVGKVCGIVVPAAMRRYGCFNARYAVRPLDVTDIMIPDRNLSSYQVVTEWNWDDNQVGISRFEYNGERENKVSHIMSDRLLADIGEGRMWSEGLAYLRTDLDYNSKSALDNGIRRYGGVRFEGGNQQWVVFDEKRQPVDTKGVCWSFSTENVYGRGLFFDFSWACGNSSANHSWAFPPRWKMEYSLDGNVFYPVGDNVYELRPVPFLPAVIKDGLTEIGFRETPYDAALGYTEHSVRLPDECMNQKEVTIRLRPADYSLTDLPQDPSQRMDCGRVQSWTFGHFFVLKFAKISINVLK